MGIAIFLPQDAPYAPGGPSSQGHAVRSFIASASLRAGPGRDKPRQMQDRRN
jgi:hypothetical protein